MCRPSPFFWCTDAVTWHRQFLALDREPLGGPDRALSRGRSVLERKDRPELSAVILPFIGWDSVNRVEVDVVVSTRGID